MFRVVGSIGLVALLASACGSRSVGPVEDVAPSAVQVDASEHLQGRIEQWRQAYEVRSFEALSPLYAQDLDVVISVQGKSHRGWSAVKDYLEQRIAGTSGIRIVTKNVALQQLGSEAAVAQLWVEFNLSADSTTVTERGELTMVLEKRGAEWVIVAEHFSYPTGAAS